MTRSTLDQSTGAALDSDDDDANHLHLAEVEAEEAEARADRARARAKELRRMVAQPDTGVRRRRQLRWPSLATIAGTVGVLVSVALLAGSAFVWRWHGLVEREWDRRAEFAAAASEAVVTLMSVDSAKVEDNVAKILANSTGEFRDDFEATARDFVDVARKSEASTKATVRAAAVESMTADSAVVLVSTATTVSDSAGVDQQPRTWRLSVTMLSDGGQLKMSRVEFVP